MSTSIQSRNAKVDILIPYWGEFTLLKKAVDSVLAQTEQNWRLLIVDDCYPSKEARNYYSQISDSRIVYYRHQKNLGLVKNYNFALSKATSEFCVIMGCDDKMLPTYIETALAKIGGADYYQPGVSIIDENDAVYMPTADRVKNILRPKGSKLHAGQSVAASLCHGNWLYFPSILWRTNVLKKYGFDEAYPNTQDVITALDILSSGGSIYVDDAVTFQYRRSASSFSSKAKSGTRFAEENKMFNELSKQFSAMGWKRAALAARLHITVRLHQLIS